MGNKYCFALMNLLDQFMPMQQIVLETLKKIRKLVIFLKNSKVYLTISKVTDYLIKMQGFNRINFPCNKSVAML